MTAQSTHSPPAVPTVRFHRTRSAAVTAPFAGIAAIALAHYWRFGYAYGEGDHDELMPLVLHRLNPAMFARDWYVMSQSDGITVRTAFSELLHALALVVPLPVAVAVVYSAALLVTIWAAYRLAMLLVPDSVGSLAGALAATVLLSRWTLGGNSVTYGLLVPEAIGWALALPAVWLFANGRRLPAAALLGVAAWFQALVGVLTAVALGLVALAEIAGGPERRSRWLQALLFGVVFAGVAAPLLVPVLLAPGFDVQAQFDPFYAMAELRVPHHYIPSAFGAAQWVRFGLVALAGAAGAWTLHRRRQLAHLPFVARLLGAVVLIGLVGIVFTEVFPLLEVAELQPFKLSVLATTVLSMLAAQALVGTLPEKLRSAATQVTAHPLAWVGVAGLAALTVGLLLTGIGRPAAVYAPRLYASSPLANAERWVRSNTSRDALFAIPPSNTTFRLHARRAVVINFKPVPFQPGGIDVWLTRLRDVAPAPLPRRGGLDWQGDLDAAYGRHDVEDWARLRNRYRLDYALVAARHVPPGVPVAYRDPQWAVLALDSGGNVTVTP